jgi:hypothetical protein
MAIKEEVWKLLHHDANLFVLLGFWWDDSYNFNSKMIKLYTTWESGLHCPNIFNDSQVGVKRLQMTERSFYPCKNPCAMSKHVQCSHGMCYHIPRNDEMRRGPHCRTRCEIKMST